MAVADAKAFYNKGVTEPDAAYITPKDAQDAIQVIYDDMGALLADAAPPNLAATAAVGVSTQAAREDHVHSNSGLSLTGHTHAQADVTSLVSDLGLKAPIASPAFTGTPTTATTPTAGDNTLKLATTAFVTAAVTAATGGGAPLASPTFTGDPKAPTPTAGDNDTSIATTQFVATSFAPIASPTFTGNPKSVTVASTDNSITIATTAYVKSVIATYKMITAYTQTTTTSTFDTTKYLSVTLDGQTYKVALVV